MGRKKTNPPSQVARFLLPVTLVELIKENALKKTGGNQSFLAIEVFAGRMMLDPKEEM